MLNRLIELLKHNEICGNCPIDSGCDGCNVYKDLKGQAEYLLDNGVKIEGKE